MKTPAPMTTKKLIKQLRDVFKLHPVKAAYLFGSYARGNMDLYSDVDLIIVYPTQKNFFERHKDFPELYDLPCAIDLLIYTPEEFSKMKSDENPLIIQALKEGVKVV